MSDFPSRRVSYADIAKRVGCHRSTVGLALKKHPGIPEHTRAKILKIADEMGYRPDPALSSLSTYRRKKSVDRGFTTIALISDMTIDADRKRDRHSIRDFYLGIQQRADELGFNIEEFSLGVENRRYEKRVDQILNSRGIRAVIIGSLVNQFDPVCLNWSHYSAVCVGYSLSKPELPKVCSDIRSGASDAVYEMYRLGYRKIGLVLGRSSDRRVDYGWSAGFYGACHDIDLKGLEHAVYMPRRPGSLAVIDLIHWINEVGVDSILVDQDDLYDYLLGNGFKIPDDLGFACLDLPPNRPELAGIDQFCVEIGRQAVDQVAALFMNNELGVPQRRLIHAVRGKWVEGKSVRCIQS